jgi:peptidoglycan/LPS O-acetylase OafA/YrhL
VYVVVAFHSGLGWFRGGFIGVDVFFVLSGYLVTRILLRDLATKSRVDFRRFYARRVRRILPAALVVLIATAVLYARTATPLQSSDAIGGFRAAFFYVSNWFFYHQSTNYFATNVNSSPVLHFWSLAVEEQFYLVWPLLLGALYVAAGRTGLPRRQVMRAVVIVAAAVSAIEALSVASTNLPRAYYGTDTRAYQLLVGAALALSPALFRLGPRARAFARGAALTSLTVLLVLATSAFTLSPITRGVWAAGCTSFLIVALWNAHGGRTRAVLSSPVFTYLGRISYGTYLWHWPVIVLLGLHAHRSPIEMFAIACLLSTVLAAVSFQLLENPVRASALLDRFTTPVVAAGFSTSIVVGLTVVAPILEPGAATIPAVATTRSSDASRLTSNRPAVNDRAPARPGVELLDWRVAKSDWMQIPDCYRSSVDGCTIVSGSGPRVLLAGDSSAHMWVPALAALAKRHALTFSVDVLDNCPWQVGVQYPTPPPWCRAQQDDLYQRVIPTFKPDVLILADRSLDDPASPIAVETPEPFSNAAGFERALLDASTQTLERVRAPGRTIVVIDGGPIPHGGAAADPLSCLSTGTSPSRCTYRANTAPLPFELAVRDRARASGVTALDLDRVVCPRLPRCDAIVDNIIVKRDYLHLTATYSKTRADAVWSALVRNRIL